MSNVWAPKMLLLPMVPFHHDSTMAVGTRITVTVAAPTPALATNQRVREIDCVQARRSRAIVNFARQGEHPEQCTNQRCE